MVSSTLKGNVDTCGAPLIGKMQLTFKGSLVKAPCLFLVFYYMIAEAQGKKEHTDRQGGSNILLFVKAYPS